MTRPRPAPLLTLVMAGMLGLAACSGTSTEDGGGATSGSTPSSGAAPATPEVRHEGTDGFQVEEIATLDQPWAMTFLPDGRALVTDKAGTLVLLAPDGTTADVAGAPEVVDEGQGGLADVVLSPTYDRDHRVYLSWVQSRPGGTAVAVGRATLDLDGAPELTGLEVIWRPEAATSGSGHYSARMAFSPDGQYLFLTSGERQKFTPAQDLDVTLGKVLRLTPDGQPAAGNPFADRGGPSAQIWSYGHRNPLGLAFDEDGRLWSSEMGPKGGDELNLIEPGKNYGWPEASNGSHYDGRDIPDHTPGDGFEPPKVWWNPSISPSSLMIYSGDDFPQWQGDAFIGALSGQALVRVDLSGDQAALGDRWEVGLRVREVEQGPDGSIWLLEDGSRVLRLSPDT